MSFGLLHQVFIKSLYFYTIKFSHCIDFHYPSENLGIPSAAVSPKNCDKIKFISQFVKACAIDIILFIPVPKCLIPPCDILQLHCSNMSAEESETYQANLRSLNSYKARRENAYASLQATFDQGKSGSLQSCSTFLARCADLNDLKDRFESIQDSIIEINSLVKPQDKLPVDSSSLSCESVYYEIKTLEMNP